jgi:hypothetical protein
MSYLDIDITLLSAQAAVTSTPKKNPVPHILCEIILSAQDPPSLGFSEHTTDNVV